VSWGWKYDRSAAHERDNDGSTPHIRSHEFQGVRDPGPWLAVSAAIEYHEQIGAAQIQSRDLELARYARQLLTQLPGLTPATPVDSELSAALVAYRLPHTEPRRLQGQLWDRYRIETPVLDRHGGPLLRVSTHFYNTHDEIDRLRAALGELLT
jgi:selenocysteine lyase/cysteine desulfurase